VPRWRAVVFDLDDTLYPERDFVRGGFEAAARWVEGNLGFDGGRAAAELWADFRAGARGDLFDRWLRAHDLDVDRYRPAMVDAYRRQTPRLRLYPDVIPTLEKLRGRVRLGLLTEGPGDSQRKKLDALALDPWFERIVVLGDDERDRWKPHPDPFDRWRTGTDVAPAEIVYIGDNPAKDFLGARRAGWSSIRVRRAGGLHEREEPQADEWAPDLEMPDFTNLPSLVAAESPM
jgi:putative hydrolase of the HAD superfamily